jgi:pimeloyl-ACP methyl ester carboxylesterase
MLAVPPYDVIIFLVIWALMVLVLAVVHAVRHCRRRKSASQGSAASAARGEDAADVPLVPLAAATPTLPPRRENGATNSPLLGSVPVPSKGDGERLPPAPSFQSATEQDTQENQKQRGGDGKNLEPAPQGATGLVIVSKLLWILILLGVAWLVTLILFAILGAVGFASMLLFAPQGDDTCTSTCTGWSETCCTYTSAANIISAGSASSAPLVDVWLQYGPNSADVIHGWYMENLATSSGSRFRNLFYCHGSGGNIASMYRLERYAFLLYVGSVRLFVLDYPGYGRSPGTPTDDSVIQASTAAFAWFSNFTRNPSASAAAVPASTKIAPIQQGSTVSAGPSTHVTLLGRSMGGAVATAIGLQAANWQIDGLLLQSVFSDLSDLSNAYFPLFGWLLSTFAEKQFPHFSNVRNLLGIAPIGFRRNCLYHSHSKTDEWVPYDEALKVEAAATTQQPNSASAANPSCSVFLSLNNVPHTAPLTPQEKSALSTWLRQP